MTSLLFPELVFTYARQITTATIRGPGLVLLRKRQYK